MSTAAGRRGTENNAFDIRTHPLTLQPSPRLPVKRWTRYPFSGTQASLLLGRKSCFRNETISSQLVSPSSNRWSTVQQSRSFCFQNIVVEISVAIDETILFTIPRICHARVSKKSKSRNSYSLWNPFSTEGNKYFTWNELWIKRQLPPIVRYYASGYKQNSMAERLKPRLIKDAREIFPRVDTKRVE